MFCSQCHTPFVIVPIPEGKSKYCKHCGSLIYRKEKDAVIIYQPEQVSAKQEEEPETREHIIREKELRYKELLERKQKEQEFRERLEQERLLREQEEQDRRRIEKEEQERLFQLQAEEEKRMRESLLKEQLEQEKKERERLENELTLRKAQEEREKQEKRQQAAQKEQQEKEKEKEKEKETARINLAASKPRTETILIKRKPRNTWVSYALPLLAGVLLTMTFTYFMDKIPFLSTKKTDNIVLASADTNLAPAPGRDILTDSILAEQLKANLTGKEILSWNAIKSNEIKDLIILSGEETKVSSNYTVLVSLSDNAGTKATAELVLYYNNILLENTVTRKITYTNIAPVGAWFSFAPVPDCSISVNTNNNPIQVKSCPECSVLKMVSNKETQQPIENTPNISIKSDNRYEAVVEFTYVPLKIN